MFDVRYVRGHVEVYSLDGSFMFSADTMREAESMMEEAYA